MMPNGKPLRQRSMASSPLNPHSKASAAAPLETPTKDKSPASSPLPSRIIEPGCQPELVYATALGPKRNSVRLWLFNQLQGESEWIADMQKRLRTRFRDRYFFWSAIFGTHTFFTAFLPLLFFLGYREKARGLVYVVGLGIYGSCVVKDLVCTPRPFSPPVKRLTVSTHHREYGFPSSHSTNAISIALFLGQWLWELRECVGTAGVAAGFTVLLYYFSSVAFGRLYAGMHSRQDVIGGSVLGIVCWLLWVALEDVTTAWIESGSLSVPAIVVPLTLALVHYHPETPDDCPCFEDAIAILAVMQGIMLGHLYMIRNPQGQAEPSLMEHGLPWGMAMHTFRIVFGIAVIFIWRLVMKALLLRILPPIFRLTSRITQLPLPTRRFYLSANSYKGLADAPIRPVPSFMELAPADAPNGRGGRRSPSPMNDALHMRASRKVAAANGTLQDAGAKGPQEEKIPHRFDPRFDPVAPNSHRPGRTGPHYDAEVLTKVIVYTGIALLASTFIPNEFRTIEGFLWRHA